MMREKAVERIKKWICYIFLVVYHNNLKSLKIAKKWDWIGKIIPAFTLTSLLNCIMNGIQMISGIIIIFVSYEN